MVLQKPLRIDPAALYDEGAMSQAGIPGTALRRARQSGKLRFTRQGRRILYLGQWILDWLKVDSEKEVAHD